MVLYTYQPCTNQGADELVTIEGSCFALEAPDIMAARILYKTRQFSWAALGLFTTQSPFFASNLSTPSKIHSFYTRSMYQYQFSESNTDTEIGRMNVLFALLVFISTIALVTAAPYLVPMHGDAAMVANAELQPIPSQPKLAKRQIPSRFQTIARRRTKKRAETIPLLENAEDKHQRKSTGGRKKHSRPKDVSVSDPTVEDGGEDGVNVPTRGHGGHGKKLKEHKAKKPKPKKPKKPKIKHNHDDDDTGSDDDPGTENLSEDENGTDRDD